MSYLVLSICFGIAVTFVLWAVFGDIDHAEVEAERSRRAILSELHDIELHRPDHLIDRGQIRPGLLLLYTLIGAVIWLAVLWVAL